MAISASNNLRRGSKGDDVRSVQTALNTRGYGLDVDGSYGPKTEAAVRDYQGKNGLTVDGIVGTNTWGLLSQTPAPSVTPSAQPAATTPSVQPAAPAATQQAPTQVTPEVAALQAVEQARPAAYQPTYQEQIDSLLTQIQQRKPFQYDFNADPLYQAYRQQYLYNGERANRDAQAAAAQLSGGFGNSYAVSAGSQAEQAYLNQLNAVIPQLQQQAYAQYAQEGQDLAQNLSLYQAAEGDRYNQYLDALGAWQQDRAYAQGQAADAADRAAAQEKFEYQKEADAADRAFDKEQFEWKKATDQRDFDYQKAQDEAALALAAAKASGSGGSGGSGGSSGGSSKSKSGSSSTPSTDYAATALSLVESGDDTYAKQYLSELRKAGYITAEQYNTIGKQVVSKTLEQRKATKPSVTPNSKKRDAAGH